VKIECFEDIIAWQKAKDVTSKIYAQFRLNRDYGFKDQIQRASVSVMNNIAEGFERKVTQNSGNFCTLLKDHAERCDQCFIRQKN
jgi:four helix bundle protein